MMLQKILDSYPVSVDYLLEILIDVDKRKDNHFISEKEIEIISKHLGIKESHVCVLYLFTHFFQLLQEGNTSFKSARMYLVI